MVVSVGCRRCYSKLSNELSNVYNNLMREPYVREIIPGGKWRWKLKDVEVQKVLSQWVLPTSSKYVNEA